ncbi:MAG: hypothetical protein RR280_10445 [Bacteroidaceae bacterium]
MIKVLNGKQVDVPKGYRLILNPNVSQVDAGDVVILRDGDQRPVEFINVIPDDLPPSHPNLIVLKGYEPYTYTDALHWEGDSQEHDSDIVAVLKRNVSTISVRGSSTETTYTVMRVQNGIPHAFVNLNGLEFNDPHAPDVWMYTNTIEASRLRERIAETGAYRLEDLIVVEVVKEVNVYPVILESGGEEKTIPVPVKEGSVVELSDGSVVEILATGLNPDESDTHRLKLEYLFDGERITAWYDKEGYTNHPCGLHLTKIQLF